MDSTTGKFDFTVDAGADYKVTVTADGYRDFVSSNNPAIVKTEKDLVFEKFSYLYTANLVPAKPGLPSILVKVADGLRTHT